MKPEVRPYTVVPALPERLTPLLELAYNLWWSWHPEATALFQRLDPDLWDKFRQNPVKLLGSLPQRTIARAATDSSFLSHMDQVMDRLRRHMEGHAWFAEQHSEARDLRVAYFSMEFGLDACLPIYSGGLGVLSGDHLKSASDLGIPLTAVGLLYHEGYFHQYLNADGWQQEEFIPNDFYAMPIRPVEDPKTHAQVCVEVEYPERIVRAQIWKIQIGRIPLYMLDTNIPENTAADRRITAQLYGGDVEHRIKQELMLGVGGLRALRALGIRPTVCHMNEGHSAFLSLERIRQLMEDEKVTAEEAREAITASNVFTTHTPVPAGNDVFAPEMVTRYLKPAFGHIPAISENELLAIGRQSPRDASEPFCMTVLALRLAAFSNGVSKLHGSVSRAMWRRLWDQLPVEEVPIGSITNGVHIQTWVGQEMAALFDRYLGPHWVERPEDTSVWYRVDEIPDAELWRTHERRRERLVSFSRRRLRQQLERRGAPRSDLAIADEVLNPEALTIGFARRFATYKRGTLILRDLARLEKMLTDRDRPVQFLFAGKAHPRDTAGKELIQKLVHTSSREPFRRHIVFLEDYDINMARYMLQGVDVWLNTPRRPQEASGTSGMKAAPNGALNLSILDGWWAEGYAVDNGWAIGAGEEYQDLDYQDYVEGRAVYDLLEREIVPLFYDRSRDDLPRGWIARMKQSMWSVAQTFNTARMMTEYTSRLYLGAHEYWKRLGEKPDCVRAYTAWRRGLVQCWNQVTVVKVEADDAQPLTVGRNLKVSAKINLGKLSPNDISVEVFYGPLGPEGLQGVETTPMRMTGRASDGLYNYEADVPCIDSGRHGYTVRVLPHHADLVNPFHTGLVRWA